MKLHIPSALRRLAVLPALLAAGTACAGACSVSTTGLAFGAYQPLTFAGKLASTPRTSDALISVVCTGIVAGGSYTIGLGPSMAGNSIDPRYLVNSSGGPDMVFNVYREASYVSIWGDGFSGGLLSGSIPIGDSNQSHTVYGKIPAGQSTLRAGTFSGTMTMTLTYNP